MVRVSNVTTARTMPPLAGFCAPPWPISTPPLIASMDSLDEARRVLQPNDRTKERDQRRLLVVESCCYIAKDAGWSLTYTTDFNAEVKQRGGRLIDPIKDVIAMVSCNARVASVHTLKSDIELVKRRFSLRDEMPVTAPRGEAK